MTQFLAKSNLKNKFYLQGTFKNIFKATLNSLIVLLICGISFSVSAWTQKRLPPHPLKDQIWTIEQAKRSHRTFFESCSACLREHFQMSGPYQNQREKLQRASRHQARFLYVVLDGLDYSDLIDQLKKKQNKKSRKKQTEIQLHSFYENTFFEKLEGKAPYLVQIEAKHPFLDKIFQRHQENKHPVLFLTSFYGPQKILSHLQERMLVKLEGDKKVLNFRIYDPLVLETSLKILSKEERSDLMGPIDNILIWNNEESSWLTLNNPQKHLLQINAEKKKAFSQLALQSFYQNATNVIEEKEPELFKKYGKNQALTALRSAFELGKKNKIVRERDVTSLAILILKYGDLSQKPQAMKIIRDKKLEPYQKISQLTLSLENKRTSQPNNSTKSR